MFALVVPYYSFFLYIRSLCYRSTGEVEDVEEESSGKIQNECPLQRSLLEEEQDVFEIDNNSTKVVTWQVIQFYRSFVMALIRTCIIDPIIRTLIYLPSLVVFLVYDRTLKPFRNPFMNILQTLSTVFLLFLVVCNTVASFSLMVDLTAIRNVKTLLRTLKYIEFSLYLVLPLSLPLWKLSMKLFPQKKKQH